MAGNTATPGASVASRVLAIIGAFDAGHRRLSLTDLARRAGLPLPTAHRLVKELTEWGALVRDEDGTYVVGRRLWDVGLLAPVASDLRSVAVPFLHDIYGATLETVHLAVREDDHVLYLDTLRGSRSVPIVSSVGSRLPMHCTGVGKVLLAHAPDDVRRRVLSSPLQRFTRYTVTSPARLEEQLERVLVDGYATTGEEMTPGACSVGVPIVTASGVVGALGIVVADLRRSRSRLVASLQVAAQGVARGLR
ncbi:IclR family transcriptional regulator [Nocardioides sp. KR10-350]|uniref:IclR family transcriptional regulator n=1 Tax=Nocardioides cheoyonin TaxID=3156615 RepID=UPI0032B40369